MARGDAGEMRGLLRRELADALAPDGWALATPARESKRVLANLVRPLQNDIAATASVSLAGSIPDRLPVKITRVHVGVSYEPLRRLWTLLGDDYELALRAEHVWPDEPDEDEDEDDPDPDDDDDGEDVDEDVDYDPEVLEVENVREAQSALDTIVAVIRRDAVPFAQRYGSLERLLIEFGYDESTGRGGARAVALLAAARRFDEARAVLAGYEPRAGDRRGDRRRVRFVHQVERYIESGGDPSIVPSRPSPSEYGGAGMPSVSEMWRETRARHEAVRAVRVLSPDTDRADLRAALERELTARGLTESPLWFEQTLDHLHDSRAEQAWSLAKGAGTVADLAFRAIRGVREHRGPPDLTPPAWLDPPDRAVYPVTVDLQARWVEVEVELDAQAAPYLERAYAAIPRLFGSTALATAWLAWDEGPRERMVVSLGQERLGTLSPAAAAAYRLVMDRAAERDELPCVPARLTPRPGTHLFEVQLPATGSRGDSDV